MPKRNNAEHQLQSECVRWFKFQYPKLRLLIWAIPNGGKRKNGWYEVSEGLRSGATDLLIATNPPLFIEMKAGNNGLTETQVEVHRALSEQRHSVFVCRSFDEFMFVVERHMMCCWFLERGNVPHASGIVGDGNVWAEGDPTQWLKE